MNGLLRWRPSKRSVVESAADAPCGSGPAILCRGLTKEFGRGETRVLALRGADFMALPGSITMLVGPSGCGKTTLASIVAGLLNPTGGELHVLGEDIRQLSPAALIAFRARHIGFVFQQYNLLPALTAAQNACLPLLVAGRRRSEAIERAREMLDRVGLGGKSEAYSSQLSGGQQQRVAIARALVHEPRLLICDEPTAALDAQSGQTVMELFCQVAVRPGRAVLIVTHDNRILHYAQRTVHMSDGRIQRVEIENTAEPPATAAASAPSPFMVELSS